MIINSHIFTPPVASPTLFGGEVAIWCPSLDTTGSGTTTLYDRVGTNHGTLTNMDAATDWVADTNSGGVRRLDFDGSDRIQLGAVNATAWSFSVWTLASNFSSVAGFKRVFGQSGFNIDIAFLFSGQFSCFDGSWKGFGPNATAGIWQHHLLTYDGTSLRAYRNATQIGLTTAGGRSLVGVSRIGDYVSGPASGDLNQWVGGLDDIRIFSRVITVGENSSLASKRGF